MEDPAGTGDVTLLVTNYSGGKRHRSGVGERGEIAELAEVVSDAGDGDLLLCMQEMATRQYGLPVDVPELERALGGSSRSAFAPRVSTAWYPLVEKWGEAVDVDASQNEGPCVVSRGPSFSLAPWALLDGPSHVPSAMRVLDLPAFEFRSGASHDDALGWITAVHDGIDGKHDVVFRPAFYGGTRDSDPRAAQACLTARAGAGGRTVPAMVVVNVHLSTLTAEYVPGRRRRVPSAEASFQRDAQLVLIARFVNECRERHGLPVVVAGDFNAEPDSVEMRAFAAATGLEPLFGADVCWRCGTKQVARPPVAFYESEHGVGGLSLTPAGRGGEVLRTDAVCSNDLCLEPRFTHKGNLMLLDNVLADPAAHVLDAALPRVDVGRGYSDHGVLSCRLRAIEHGASPSRNRKETAE